MIPKLTESESFVKGRSIATAKALLEAAGDRAAEVRTTSHGYIVPSDILTGEEGYTVSTAADRPAVPTEPDTSTNVEEVNNVGGAATAVAAEGEAAPAQFDPSAATVDEVNEYLANTDDAERERVLAAETDGKKRKGILEAAATPEGDK